MSICIRAVVGGGGEVDRYLVLARQVCVGDFGIRDLKCRAIGNIERQLGLSELSLAPVPATERMLLALEIDAVPELEKLRDAVVVLFV